MRLKLNSGRQSGFTLLEVVIAILVLAIGLLGLASLQATGMRLNYESQLRSQATILAYDITDRIRANANPRGNFDYEISDTDSPPNGNAIHQVDLREWRTALAAALPNGTGAIVYDASNRIVIVRVFWSGRNNAGDAENPNWACDIPENDDDNGDATDSRACFEIRTLLSL